METAFLSPWGCVGLVRTPPPHRPPPRSGRGGAAPASAPCACGAAGIGGRQQAASSTLRLVVLPLRVGCCPFYSARTGRMRSCLLPVAFALIASSAARGLEDKDPQCTSWCHCNKPPVLNSNNNLSSAYTHAHTHSPILFHAHAYEPCVCVCVHALRLQGTGTRTAKARNALDVLNALHSQQANLHASQPRTLTYPMRNASLPAISKSAICACASRAAPVVAVHRQRLAMEMPVRPHTPWRLTWMGSSSLRLMVGKPGKRSQSNHRPS
jgi:hypothetical protein